MSGDPSLDPPTVVGHKPTGLPQPRFGALPIYDPPTTPIAPPPPARTAAPAQPAGGLFSPQPPTPRAGRADAAQVRPAPARETAPAPIPQAAPDPADPSEALVAAANPLLTVVAQLRDTVEFADVGTLRTEVINQIHKFEEAAIKHGGSASDIQAARYILCSLIDETVMTTPWGSASDWSTSSLLNRFHNETWGGEKVFAILDRIKSDPRRNISLLKLIDFVLLLGFEGMHRVLDNGRERLSDLREEVGQLVAQHSAPPPTELSRSWQGIGADRSLRTFFPLWIVFAAAGFVLVCVYSYQRYRLSAEMAPIVERLRGLENSVSAGGNRP